MISPRAWKTSFSDFHRSYSPKTAQRFSLKSPEKPRRGTLSRESSTLAVSPQSPPGDSATSEPRDPSSREAAAELKAGEDDGEVEGEKLEEPEPKPDGDKAPPSESSCELNNSCDSESLELQLAAADGGPLHIQENEDLAAPKSNGLENGDVSGFNSDDKDLNIPHKVCHLIST